MFREILCKKVNEKEGNWSKTDQHTYFYLVKWSNKIQNILHNIVSIILSSKLKHFYLPIYSMHQFLLHLDNLLLRLDIGVSLIFHL